MVRFLELSCSWVFMVVLYIIESGSIKLLIETIKKYNNPLLMIQKLDGFK